MRTAIKSMNKSQLCELYNISIETLNKWLMRKDRVEKLKSLGHDFKKDRIFGPRQVAYIIGELGDPEGYLLIKEDDQDR